MTPLMIVITTISIAGLLAISIYKFIKSKNWKNLIFQILIIVICFGFLYFFFYAQEEVTTRGGGNNDVYLVIVLYIFMLLGMLAQYLYTRFEQPKSKRKKFDFGLFMAPVFASPIIFIPLLAALQNANINFKELTTAKLMVFFVAFENGFFWKEYFDNRRKEKLEV